MTIAFPSGCPTSLIPIEELPPDKWITCMTWKGFEPVVARYLAKRRVNFFLPIERKRVWRGPGDVAVTESARFPRYLFLNGPDARDAVLERSSRSEDKCGVRAVAARESVLLHGELTQLCRAIEVNPYLRTVSTFKPGSRVRICVPNPLAGVEGVVEKVDDHFVVYLNCKMMGRATLVEVLDADQLEFAE